MHPEEALRPACSTVHQAVGGPTTPQAVHRRVVMKAVAACRLPCLDLDACPVDMTNTLVVVRVTPVGAA